MRESGKGVTAFSEARSPGLSRSVGRVQVHRTSVALTYRNSTGDALTMGNTGEMSLRQMAKVLGFSHTLLVLSKQGKRKLSPELESRYHILVTDGGYKQRYPTPSTAVQSRAHGSEANIQSPVCYHYTTRHYSSSDCSRGP